MIPRFAASAAAALAAAALACSLACPFAEAAPAGMPRAVGTCAKTVITAIGTRFSDRLVKPRDAASDDGTGVQLKNGVYGVSYSYVAEVAQSRVGDPVLTCLVSVPRGCPKGDDRGKTYTTTNLRTQGSWTLPDSQHLCGGA